MIRSRFLLAFVLASTLLAGGVAGQHSRTVALFDLGTPASAPFPSDWFTVPDDGQNTGRRVSLPLPPDCTVYISDCQDLAVINKLDGFNLQPRISIPFTGAIDPSTVNSGTVFLVSLGSTLPEQELMPQGTVVGIDQVVWDPSTNTVHVESDALLAQHTRFALIATHGVRDADGAPVKPSDAFQAFRATVREDYKNSLLDAMQAARHRGVEEDDIAVASVFTTQSATAVLEKIRDQIHDQTPDPADFYLGANGEHTVFSPDEVSGITWIQQTGANPPDFTSAAFDISALQSGAVQSVAFGKYTSPDYQLDPAYIPIVATGSGTPEVQAPNEIYFNLYLPAGPKPSAGWPVAILGHGVGASKNVGENNARLAAHGIASVAINAVGNGFGALGTLIVSRTSGTSVTLPAGGRGLDMNADGKIANNEGNIAAAPRHIVFYSDAFRQTAADLMQLTRLIEVGMDVDGDGQTDLDVSRIYYQGGSWGGGYGNVFVGIEPHVRVAVISSPVNPVAIGTLALGMSIRGRATGALLGSRQPSLLNAPGITVLDGVPVPSGPFFDENQPLRKRTPLIVQVGSDGPTRLIQSPVTNDVAGAIAIQEMLEHYEWVSQAGSPAAYAPHLRKAPLGGAAPKDVLCVILKGDQTAPNPTTAAIVRAAELADRTLYYRHDLARADYATLPKNPHAFGFVSIFSPNYVHLAPLFFASDGAVVIQPTPVEYFEFPIVGALPEGLNYIR